MAKEKTLKDNIYNSILEGIIDYEYVPNQIITEKEMVQKYGCSKSPIPVSYTHLDVYKRQPQGI